MGALFFGSLASGSPGTSVPAPVGDQGQISPGDTWGLQSAELLGKLSVFFLKKTTGCEINSVCCPADLFRGVLETVVLWIYI